VDFQAGKALYFWIIETRRASQGRPCFQETTIVTTMFTKPHHYVLSWTGCHSNL